MRIFYYDDKIEKYEKELDFVLIIKELEKKYYESNSTIFITTLIASSWYYLIEGGFLLNNNSFDDEPLKKKWAEYLKLGCKNSMDDEYFCFIAGYVLTLHWFLLDSKYKKKGMELLKRCYQVARTREIKEMAVNLMQKKPSKLKYTNKICNEFFPTNSLLDTYFKEIYLR